MEFLASNKGGILACLDGHIYIKIRNGKVKIFWPGRSHVSTANLEVFEATLLYDPRNNNLCEGWNNKFYNLVGHPHPSIWRAITWMQKEQESVSTILEQDASGQRHRRKVRMCYIKMQERLRNLCLDRQLREKTIEEFLRGISWNICHNKTQ